MTRPTDEITGKVIAKQHDWQYEPRIEHGTPKLRKIGGHNDWRAPLSNLTGDDDVDYVADPRDDTDAALELLHHIGREINNNGVMQINANDETDAWYLWNYWNGDDYGYLPISGEPFRYAVVNLAADVLGVG